MFKGVNLRMGHFAITMVVVLLSIAAQGQNRLNFGLSKPQSEATLPKGNAPAQVPVLRPRSGERGTAVPVGNSVYKLNSGWALTDNVTQLLGNGVFDARYNPIGWYDAAVPGTVLTSLVRAGKYPDPYFGLNNLAIPDSVCRKDWWYRTTFETPAGEKGKMAWLCFDGINYKARIWLNGDKIGDINGAFARGRFDVTNKLKEDSGPNVLLVQLLPPNNPGIPNEQSARSGMGANGGQLTMDGPTFFATEGWDWIPGIRDRDMGIWQDVGLVFTGSVTAADPQVITDLPLPDTASARIILRTEVVNNAPFAQQASLQFSFEGVTVMKQLSLGPGEVQTVTLSPDEYPQLKLSNPRLWWPNGYGQPNLYHSVVRVADQKGITEISPIRFGIREYSYEMMADTEKEKAMRFEYSPTDLQAATPVFDFTKRREFENRIFIPSLVPGIPVNKLNPLPEKNNPFLVIRVNGKRVFCKGGNWGMDDAMKQVSRERMEPAFKLHRNANFNMIRNWTGVNMEPVFFELADEYGMMVWNDFWISTEGFNLNPTDQVLFLQNSLDVIRRYRNHPSIAIWCPRNEGYAPPGLAEELAAQVAKEDGTRHYHGNSREANLRPSGPWHFFENNKDYYTRHGKGFTTEIGTFSVPEASTIRKFIDPLDQWPINDVWHYHDLHADKQNLEGYLHAVDSLYGESQNLDDFNRKVQLVNYESHRAIFEAWNSNLWQNSSGVLLWMSHPAWPSMIWQTYSWDFQTHGSYYGSKKACEPLHIQLNLHNNKVLAINTSLEDVQNAKVGMDIFSLDGKLKHTKTLKTGIPANMKTDLFEVALDSLNLPSNYLVRLWIKDNKGQVIATNEYWKANSTHGDFKAFNFLTKVTVSGKVLSRDNCHIAIELENRSATPAIGVKLDALDKGQQILLPAYFSEGYFTLLPREKKMVFLELDEQRQVEKIKISGYNLAGMISGKKINE